MSYKDDENEKGVFGEVITAHKSPIVQLANKYQLDPATQTDKIETFSASGGSVDNDVNLFRCKTGTSLYGYGVIRSKETLNYHAGQGIEAQFTAKFTTGIANSLQFGGLFNLTDTIAMGYNGEDFSCIHSRHGVAELQLITVTATGAGTCTVTLNDDVKAITVTNSNVQQNAEEIRAGLAGDATLGAVWRFEQVDDKVYCIAKATSPKAGTFSITGGVTATIVQQNAGAFKTDGHIAQDDFNFQQPFEGFDPTQLNIYKIKFGFLGVANIQFFIYNPNIGRFEKVHQIKWANSYSQTHVSNPNFKIGWTSASLGSSGTDLIVEGGSVSMMIEGDEFLGNDVHAITSTEGSVGTTSTNLITIKNRLVHGSVYNLGKVKPLYASASIDHTKGAVIEIRKNTTISGFTNYQLHEDGISIITYTTGGTVTNGDLIGGFPLSANGNDDLDLTPYLVKMLPEDTLTISARTESGTATTVTGFITWKEEK